MSRKLLSRNKIKLIRSLEHRKYRQKHGLFVMEGEKIILDLVRGGEGLLKIRELFAPAGWIEKNLPPDTGFPVYTADPTARAKASFQKSPQGIIALIGLPQYPADLSKSRENLSLVLDTVQDPGNLGVILRIADWFGIQDVYCSPETADAFAPKTIQASMGALNRVRVHYLDLVSLCRRLKSEFNICILAATMQGTSIYDTAIRGDASLLLGNESKGISAGLLKEADLQISIPSFQRAETGMESLNVSVAAGILVSEIQQRRYSK